MLHQDFLFSYQNRDMAFWLVSHCDTVVNREGYVGKLQEYIPVDIYGRCGIEECSRHADDCFAEMSERHLFYIAFENSICDEYLTEKFYRTLNYPVIPIVMGGADYNKLAPPHSFIDINDFESVEALSKYLTRLSRNPKEYSAYFKWKETHDVYTFRPFCQLCEKLHQVQPGRVDKIVENGYDWWYKRPNGEATCSDGSERKYFKDIKDFKHVS